MHGTNASSQATRRGAPEGRYDAGIVLAAIGLASLGLVMVASSSISIADNQQIGAFHYLTRHIVFLALGGALAFIVARTELALVERHAFLLLLLAFILLLLVFVPGIGMRVNGARRWINLGISGFQSVEMVKLILIVYLASYLVRHRDSVHVRLLGGCTPLAVAGHHVGVVMGQPEFC
jgi:cell division protein FtsW